jgi:hypothetical protein
LPPEQCAPAEDFLYHLAAGQAPSAPAGADDAARARYRDAWAAWWREHGPGVTLARPDHAPRLLGYTLVVEIDFGNETGRVLERDSAGRTRWQVTNLAFPRDAHLLPGGRLLVVERDEEAVTERDLQGKVLRRFEADGEPLNAQRLPGGNTFIALRSELRVVDEAGKVVSVLRRPNKEVRAAVRLRNGQTVLVTTAGQCLRLDAAGRELASFPVGKVTSGALEVLPDGRVLVAPEGKNKVVEYGREGKVVWEAAVPAAFSATRLPNGHTLVACTEPPRVVELNRAGTVIGEFRTSFPPVLARGR